MQRTFWGNRQQHYWLILVCIGLVVGFGRNALTAQDTDQAGRPIGNVIARIYYDDITDIAQFEAMGADVHEYNNLQEKYVLAGIDGVVFDRLISAEWELSIDAAATKANSVQRIGQQSATPGTYYGGYRTVAEMEAILAETTAAHPTITELIDYGDSYCKQSGPCDINGTSLNGYDLSALRIGNENNAAAPMGFGNRPVLFISAAAHSRELSTAEQALFYIDHLTSNYGTDPDITWLVDWHDIYVVPMANPDGRFVVEAVDAPGSQRKNAHQNGTDCNALPGNGWTRVSGQPGVDLNRNHTYQYNTGGSSDYNCALTYRGQSAASEPEVANLEAFIRSVIPDQRGTGNAAAPATTSGAFISMHAYGDLVLWPWGYITSQAPNHTGLKAIGDKLGSLTGYTSCQPSICLYNASGTSDDWAYGELGVPAFTYEVGSSADGFFPSYATARDVHWEEVRESLIYSARIVRRPYQLAHGPDVTSLAVTELAQNLFTISAELSDAQNGNQAIASAELFVGTPPWAAGATAIQMPATDGAFDNVGDSAELTLNSCTQNLPNGQHLIWARGLDSGGNAGPVWAQWLTITNATDCGTEATAITTDTMSTTTLSTTINQLLLATILLAAVTLLTLKQMPKTKNS